MREEQQQQRQQQQNPFGAAASASSTSSSSNINNNTNTTTTTSRPSNEVADDSLKTISVERLVKLYGHKTAEHRILVGHQEGRPIIRTVPGTKPDTPKSLGDIDVDPANLPCQTIVQFKNQRLLQVPFPMFVAPGEYVFVDIDRGKDLGVVIFTATSVLSPSGGKQLLAGLRNARLGKIVGVASAQSRGLGIATEAHAAEWHTLGQLEAKAVRTAAALAADHKVALNFLDAEYQFDRSKLTVYYPRDTPKTDFRELVRAMYKAFRARIWLEPMGENVSGN